MGVRRHIFHVRKLSRCTDFTYYNVQSVQWEGPGVGQRVVREGRGREGRGGMFGV